MQCYEGMQGTGILLAQIRQVRGQLKSLSEQAKPAAVADALATLDKKIAALVGSAPEFGRSGGEITLSRLMADLTALLETLQAADVTPTTQAITAVRQTRQALIVPTMGWFGIMNGDMKALNEQLQQARLPAITVEPR